MEPLDQWIKHQPFATRCKFFLRTLVVFSEDIRVQFGYWLMEKRGTLPPVENLMLCGGCGAGVSLTKQQDGTLQGTCERCQLRWTDHSYNEMTWERIGKEQP